MSAIASNLDEQRRPGARRNVRVLVIEDDSLVASLIADYLCEAGYTVVGPAATVTEAVRLVATAKVNVAVLDMTIDGKFADEVAKALSTRQIPFMFLSGYDDCPDARYKSIPLVHKPFDMAQLKEAIDCVLSAHH